jgi:hypothetical protein
MKAAIGRAPRALIIVPILLAALVLGASTAEAAFVHESLPEFETQLKGGQIREAAINRRLKTVRLTLTDGRHMLITYSRGEEPRVRSELEAKHVPVSVLNTAQAKKAPKKAVKHKLRYIAGGIVVAIVVIVGGVMLYNRRKQRT